MKQPTIFSIFADWGVAVGSLITAGLAAYGVYLAPSSGNVIMLVGIFFLTVTPGLCQLTVAITRTVKFAWCSEKGSQKQEETQA